MVAAAAIAFATDEAFAPLAKGLVLSIIDRIHSGISLCLVDIGCSSSTIEWMRRQGVTITTFDRKSFLPIKSGSTIRQYQNAQLCRPFLPALFPGHEIYLWCDSDLWIQHTESIELYCNLANDYRNKIPIAPLVDSSYKFHYEDGKEFMRYAKIWFAGCYGAVMGQTYCDKAILSSGMFALHRDNPLWKLWGKEIGHIFSKGLSSHDIAHLAEQTALSYLAYSTGAFIPIEAIHNYNCHVGCAARRNGRVVIDIPPYREIGVVHLTYSSKRMSEYIKSGLLYQMGNYLAASEIASLSLVTHY